MSPFSGDERTPLKEAKLINIDDDKVGSGNLSENYLSYHKPTVVKDLGGSNQEREKKKTSERKRDLRLNLNEDENNYIHGNGVGIN
ncbi:uncharacterized protein J3R85_017133 [Psidium guajava]|nr:uncharacterized protein J3R85_017133 [Psidium guajava]